jgi:hypothetical protein
MEVHLALDISTPLTMTLTAAAAGRFACFLVCRRDFAHQVTRVLVRVIVTMHLGSRQK